jgi:hypothetical protein
MSRDTRHRWCLLIHTLPARPLYLRARIRRLLAESGAAPLKKAVYALPATPDAMEQLRRIAAEIEAGGGSALVCEATVPDDETDQRVIRACNDERHRQFREWTSAAETEIVHMRSRAPVPERIAQLRQRFASLEALDHFHAPGAGQARAILARLDREAAPARSRKAPSLVGRTWVTRRGLHVDRLACAWLVRRFIDPSAAFRFTATPAAALATGEIGFDMPGAEISHEDGGCSAETLVRRAGLEDRTAKRIAEIVHDIDLKDARYQHPETAGFEQMLLGVLASNPLDTDRLARGLELFDAFYAALSRGVQVAASAARVAPRLAVPPALRRRRPVR